jgi:hypothetical protein
VVLPQDAQLRRTRDRPALRRCSPVSSFMNVDLPEPLVP